MVKLSRLYDISLKWKLLIPFLFLAFVGASALFVVSYRFQATLIHLNEEKRLMDKYNYFLGLVESGKEQVLGLASMIAENPVVAEAFAQRDRTRLMAMLRPCYEELRQDYGIKQIHFHVPPATSFLRIHLPERFGDDMQTYRHTINLARERGQGVGGLEKGMTGFGLRGVVPVTHEGALVGTVEVGSSFGMPLLEQFKRNYNAEVSIYIQGEPLEAGPKVFASTLEEQFLPLGLFNTIFCGTQPVFRTEKWQGRDVATIAGPVCDFSLRTVAVVEISVDRSRTMALLKEYGTVAIIIGVIGLALSISFVWIISAAFTGRIRKVVEASEEIARGHRDTRIAVKSADELGVMARSINEMLASLEESRRRIKDYAENLELMVEQRTRSLRESEQTYRTLVEHVPVIVYLVMPDGTAMFLNHFVEETIGVPPQRLSGHHEAWAEHIHPPDRQWVLARFEKSLREGKEFHAEYRMVHRDGHLVYVVDHAIPVFDDQGNLTRLDGIIVDVTARKELQEKVVQAEALETLSGVSARLAHEIRNPLTSIGGLTRRLVRSFEDSDPRKKKGELIVEEVKKLEKILRMITAYIEPKSIQLRPCNLNRVVEGAAKRVNAQFGNKDFSVACHLDGSLGTMNLDCPLIEDVLTNLMENAFYRMQQKGKIEVATGRNGRYATVTISYEVPFISDDDIEHFFYPFVIDYPFEKDLPERHIMDIPICTIVVHKHGGLISASKENNNRVRINLSLPLE
jgi:PAS domain S-box-containing protein